MKSWEKVDAVLELCFDKQSNFITFNELNLFKVDIEESKSFSPLVWVYLWL